jgi:hypothetical protein
MTLASSFLVIYFKRLGSKTFAHAQNVLCTETAASMRLPSILRSSASDTTCSGGTISCIFYLISVVFCVKISELYGETSLVYQCR